MDKLIIYKEIGIVDEDICACEYKRLCVNNNIVLAGDAYHDKIEYQIEGFLKALKFLKIDFTIKNKNVECPYENY